MLKIFKEDNHQNFIEALTLDKHPMRYTKDKFKLGYYIELEHLIMQDENDEYTRKRLGQYREFLIWETLGVKFNDKYSDDHIYSRPNKSVMSWQKKESYWLLSDVALILMCDAALILLNEAKIREVGIRIHKYLTKDSKRLMQELFITLYSDIEIPYRLKFLTNLVKQFRINRDFLKMDEKCLIVTANMSAGKSTLINAIIGKPLVRTSQEVCTGNLCYLYNKPFEDDNIHLSTSSLNLNVSYKELNNVENSKISSIAAHFRINNAQRRICVIDTPGVNSAINRNHKEITRKVLKEKKYHKLLYVLNANSLGTDDEKEHLRWVLENVPKDKVVFVLNKLDNFKIVDDSIEESIKGVKNDLVAMGYKNPRICPISAYFAFLLKQKENCEIRTEDESDEFEYYTRKFSKAKYDLSNYVDGVIKSSEDSKLIEMSKKCGLYGFEKIIFEGESI